MSGGATWLISRTEERSALLKPGWASSSWFRVGKVPNMYVTRSSTICRTAASTSKSTIVT